MKKLIILICALTYINLAFAQNTSKCAAPDTAIVTNTANQNYFPKFKLAVGNLYTFRWKLPSDKNWNELHGKYGSLPSAFTMKKLPNNTTFQAQIVRKCSGGVSEGKIFTFTTKKLLSTCDTPENIGISKIYTDGALVTWKPQLGALGYVVTYRYDDPLSWFTIEETKDSFLRIEGLMSGKKYQVYIVTICENGHSPNSDGEIFFTTLAKGTKILQSSADAEVEELEENQSIQYKLANVQGNSADTQVQVYPNPSSQWIRIQGLEQNGLPFEASILDNTGRIALNNIVQSDIDISSLQEGFYLMKILLNNNQVIVKKFIISR